MKRAYQLVGFLTSNMNCNRFIFGGLIIITMVFLNKIQAQDIQISYLGGQIKKHSPKLLYATPPYAQGIELSYYKYTSDQVAWQKYWGKPIVDFTSYMVNFGDNDVLGTAFGVMPALHFFGFRKQNTSLRFSIGAGIAYLTKQYDLRDNPLNNAIGSNINNGTRFGINFDYKNASIGGNLYHFSNGSTSTPNSGINTLLVNLSYRFSTSKKKPIIEYQRITFKEEEYKKWGLDIMAVRGYNQFVVPGGPTYNISSISLGGYRSLSPFIRLHSGLEYEYNETLYNFYINDFHTEKEANDLAYNSVWYVACELFFGNIGFRPKIGYYLPYPIPEAGDPFYIKLETHYYPLGRNKRISPYLGLSLKSHYAVAQYASVEVGINL